MTDYDSFYTKLFAPVVQRLGPLDPTTIVSVVGFDAGGPLNFATIGASISDQFVTYISCELAVRREQKPSRHGRYELLATSDDEHWVRHVLTKVGWMSMETELDDGHTIDIGAITADDDPIQGVGLERFTSCRIGAQQYCVLRVHGLARNELEQARSTGLDGVLDARRARGIYPRSSASDAAHQLNAART